MPRGPCAGLLLRFSLPFCIFTKERECGLGVDCNLPLYVLRFIFENVHVGASNML